MSRHALPITLVAIATLLLAACAPAAAPSPTATPGKLAPAKPGAKAAWKPEAPVEVVTQSSAGGGGDVVGRQVIEAIKGQLPQPIVMVNKPGAGGANLQSYVADRPADGHTLIVTTPTSILWYYTRGLKQNPVKDWRPVIRLQVDPTVIVVRADAPYTTLDEFIEAARAGETTWAGGPAGGLDHLIPYSLSKQANFKLSYVAYGGGGEATTALLGGHVDAIAGQVSENIEHVQAGKLRFLGQTSEKRYEIIKDVPTLKEKGFDVVFEQWRGIFIQRVVPDAAVQYWHDVIRQGSQAPGFKKYMDETGQQDGYMDPEQYQKFVDAESKAYDQLTAELGLNKQK